MAKTDLEKLVVQLSADIKGYEREFRKANLISATNARAVERHWRDTNKRIAGYARSTALSIIGPFSGVAGVLTVREVLNYADAWTKAKNSLATAGVVGTNQKRILDALFQSAQDNAVPIEALTSLYGKASQVRKELAASDERLIEFSDGVATSLKVEGKSAEVASGALQQLGQLLGSTRVQAEEFNSVKEGARPILIAVANGIDAAGGSVAKLKQLVNAGEVSNKEFFDGFLRGLPVVKAMAANALPTLEQGYIRIRNALTKYIGETDSSLGVSQRLALALSNLAEDFDETADMALQLASVIAGALVGRSLAGMVTKIVLSGAALTRFIRLLRTAQSVARTGIVLGGLGTAAGPIGAALGIAAAAAFAFSDASDAAGASTESAAEKAERYAEALKRVTGAANEAGAAVEAGARRFDNTEKLRQERQIEDDAQEVEKAASKLLERLQEIVDIGAGTGLRQVQGLGFEVSASEISKVKTIIDQVKGGLAGSVDEALAARDGLAAMARENPGLRSLQEELQEIVDRLVSATEELRKGRQEAQKWGDAVSDAVQFDPRRTDGLRSIGEGRETARALDQRLADAQRSQLEQQIDARAKEIVKEFGDKISEQAARIQARAEITLDTQTRGGEGAVSGYVDRTISAESGGNRFAKNPRSSAEGLGQFIDSTWLSLFRKHFPGEAAQLSQAAILALKTDAAKSKQLIEAYGNENAAALRAAGIAVTDAADEYKLHLAHFLGPAGAAAVLKAAPGTPLRDVLGADQIRANPEVLGGNRTVEDAIAYGQRRAGLSTTGTQRLDSRENFQAQLAEYKQTIDFLKEETGLRASLNPLIEDYGRGLTTLQAAQELLTMAQQEGTAAGRELSSAQQLLTGNLAGLTPEAREQALAMRELAEASGAAQAESNRLDETQGRLRDNMGEVAALGKDVFSGFVQDLRNGKDATEALGNALGRLGDKLLSSGLDLLFDGPVAGSGKGALGGLFSFLLPGFASGGRVRGQGGPRGDKIPIMVSDGEHVTNARSAKKYGPLLDAINNDTLAMLADGGWPIRAPVIAPFPTPQRGRGGSTDTVNVTLRDDSGRMAEIADQRIVTRSGTIVNVAVQRASANVMPTIAAHRTERAGSDWRR